MEQKNILLSALGVGVGVGVGLGLASGQTVSGWVGGGSFRSDGAMGDKIEKELGKLVVNGRDSNVKFDEFPYYLSEQTWALLTSAAYVHLKHSEISRHTRNLSPASRTILLSGSSELYQQMLATALAHFFESKLLLLDINELSLKANTEHCELQSAYISTMQNKYGVVCKESSLKKSISELTMEHMSALFNSFTSAPPKDKIRGSISRLSSNSNIKSRYMEESNNSSNHRRNASAMSDTSSVFFEGGSGSTAFSRRTCRWCFDEKLLLQSIYKVLVSISETNPVILYLRDVEKLFNPSDRLCKLFLKMVQKLSGSVLIIGSRMLDNENDCQEIDERLALLFPYNIEIRPPVDEIHFVSWKAQLEEDMKMLQIQDNKNHIAEVLAANDIICDDLGSICLSDTIAISNYIEEIVVSALSYHLINNEDPEYRNGKLVISSKSISHGLDIFQQGKSVDNNTLKMDQNTETAKENEEEEAVSSKTETKLENHAPKSKNETEKSISAVKKDAESAPSKVPEVPPDNEFEKRIRSEVIPASEIGVTFADIGALDEIKESLQELVMLPLRRPDLFKGGLLKPCRGILLFGPPGTGKTMLAKAIANEAGASFINVSMSTITSMWFGEDEKNVRALFTLAEKVSPTIMFIDEADSMLGQRTQVGEHEAMRKIKNEFMTHWDGLLTNTGERILVLAATNRPFDLDEAIIRRFERRIMVGLPSIENREMILKTLLSKEKVENLDYKEIATMTEGYSGSYLKNLCMTAAYRPLRELIQQERQKDLERKGVAEKAKSSEDAQEVKVEDEVKEGKDEPMIKLRPLTMEDLRQAKNQVAASFASEGSVMSELTQWNDLYGEGGSRKKQQLSYFV